MSTVRYLPGAASTLLAAELNALANNALALSAAYDNSTNLYPLAEVEFATTAAFGTAPLGSTGLSVWWLRDVDGTNYEDGGTGLTPSRAPDLVIPVEAQNATAQRVRMACTIPPGTFKALVKNDGTGQALPATGNTLKILPYTYQAA